MPCNCKKFAPKGTKPKGVGGKGAPKVKNLRVSTNAANQALGYAKKAGIKVKVPKVTVAKPKAAKKVSARVAYYHKRQAAALKKANANPCKCTPGKP